MTDSNTVDLESNKILVVDDDAFMRKTTHAALSGLGFEHVILAEDGVQALEVLENEGADLLLTDIQMPNMNGLELIKIIRTAHSSAPRYLPVVVMTGISDDDTLSSAIALDVNGLLSKPVKPLSVVDKVVQAMSESTLALREIDYYQQVVADLSSLKEKNGATIAADPRASSDKVSSVSLLKLQPDMRLAQGVRHVNGSLLLAANYVLTQRTINRLYELHDNIADEFFLVEDQG